MTPDLEGPILDILTDHAVHGFNGSEILCRCTERRWFGSKDYRRHVATALVVELALQLNDDGDES